MILSILRNIFSALFWLANVLKMYYFSKVNIIVLYILRNLFSVYEHCAMRGAFLI